MAGHGAPIGNTNASKSNRLWGDTIKRIAVQEPHKLKAIAEALYLKAAEGDVQAAKEIGDRLDGKALAVVDVTHREAENVSDQQARMMAEAYIESARRPGIRPEAANTVRDSEPS